MKITNTLAKRAALSAVLVLGSSAWLSAQTSQDKIPQPESGLARPQEAKTAYLGTNSQSAPLMKINNGSSLIGTTVKNQQGEDLGKIRDLVIDFSNDRVAYVVLDSGIGVFNSQKLHAVPLRAFQPDAAGTSLVLNADKGKLANSEGFDKSNWPGLSTAAWGAEPFWKDIQGASGSQEGRDVDQQSTKDQLIKETTPEPKKTESQPQQ